MPARPKIPDPADGPLQAFAFDLRQLGAGKAPVAWIAGHHETQVSRAALYAALSGTRISAAQTVGTLLRWWAGNPPEESGPIHPWTDLALEWMDRLPAGHAGRKVGAEWRARHERLAREQFEHAGRQFRDKPLPVVIDLPPEQRAYIEALLSLIRQTGLEGEMWLLFGYHVAGKVETYLAGRCVPTDGLNESIVRACVRHIDGGASRYLRTLDRLNYLAHRARAGRARERRIARLAAGREAGEE